MTEKWSEWIKHDGKGCPVVGHYVEVEGCYLDGSTERWIGIVLAPPNPAWDWGNSGKVYFVQFRLQECGRILRYRVRRPRGMAFLDRVLADLWCEGVE